MPETVIALEPAAKVCVPPIMYSIFVVEIEGYRKADAATVVVLPP
jgi:hypothetical protein